MSNAYENFKKTAVTTNIGQFLEVKYSSIKIANGIHLMRLLVNKYRCGLVKARDMVRLMQRTSDIVARPEDTTIQFWFEQNGLEYQIVTKPKPEPRPIARQHPRERGWTGTQTHGIPV